MCFSSYLSHALCLLSSPVEYSQNCIRPLMSENSCTTTLTVLQQQLGCTLEICKTIFVQHWLPFLVKHFITASGLYRMSLFFFIRAIKQALNLSQQQHLCIPAGLYHAGFFVSKLKKETINDARRAHYGSPRSRSCTYDITY